MEDSLCEGINFDCPDEANNCFRFWMKWVNFQNPAWKWNFAVRFSHSQHSACFSGDGTTFPISPLHDKSPLLWTTMNPIIYHQEIYIYDLNILSYFKRVCLIEDGAEILSMNWMWSVNVDCANDDNLSTEFVLQNSVVCNNAFSQS